MYLKNIEPLQRFLKTMERMFSHRLLLPYYPTDLNIEVSTICNAKCTCCPHGTLIKNGTRPNRFMNLDNYKKTIDWFKEITKNVPSKDIWLTPVGLGETLLHPDLFNLLQYSRQSFPESFIHLATNGIALDKKTIDVILHSEININRLTISINFFDKNTYQEIVGIDKLDEVLQNTRTFLKKRKSTQKTALELQMLNITKNKRYIPKFIKYWRPLLQKKDRIYIREFTNFCGSVDSHSYDIKDQKISSPLPCVHLWNTIIVNVDGFVFPCCMGVTQKNESSLCVGQVGDNFNDMFKKIQKIRKNHLTDNLNKECLNCSELYSLKKFSKDKLRKIDSKQYHLLKG